MTDVVYRTGFGTSSYGARAFGVDGATKAVASTVITVSASVAAWTRVWLPGSFGSAPCSHTSATTPLT